MISSRYDDDATNECLFYHIISRTGLMWWRPVLLVDDAQWHVEKHQLPQSVFHPDVSKAFRLGVEIGHANSGDSRH